MECKQKKQLAAYPKVRIEKSWLRQFFSNKSYHNEGTTHLFSLAALYSYANFRSNYRCIEGDTYLESPGQWICRLGSLPRIMRVHSKQQALETLTYLRDAGFLRFEWLPTEKDWLRYELCAWQKYGIYLAYNYYSYKSSGFFFFPIPIGRALMKTSAKQGKRVFSELDALVDMWLHTVYRDPEVAGSEILPVLYYTDMKGRPLLSNAYLSRRWGWSKSRTTRFLCRLERDGLMGCFRFTSTRGSVISLVGYLEMLHGAGAETGKLPRAEFHEILSLVVLVTEIGSPENLRLRVAECGPCPLGAEKMRYVLEIEALEVRGKAHSLCRASLIYHSYQGSSSSTVVAETKGETEKEPANSGAAKDIN